MQCGHHMFALRLTPLWLIAALVNVRSAVSLKGEHLADHGSNEDVDVLGGDLNDLMSNLEEPVAKKEDEDGTNLLEVGKTDVEDGAMSKIKEKLSAEESKNKHLKEQIAQAESWSKNLQDQMEHLHGQLQAGEALLENIHDVAHKDIVRLRNEVAGERKQVQGVELQSQRSRHTSELREKAMQDVREQIDISNQKAAAIRLRIHMTAQENEELRGRLRGTASNTNQNVKLSSAAQQQMDEQSQLQATANSKLRKLDAAVVAEDERVALLEKQRNSFWERQLLATRPEQVVRDENNHLKEQLSAEKQQEKRLQQVSSNGTRASKLQLRQGRSIITRSLSQLEKTRAAMLQMHEEAQRLGDIVFKIGTAQGIADLRKQQAQVALAETSAENKQLKEHTVPWLELEADQQHQESKRAAQLLQQASDARDTSTAVLSGAQKNIVEAQGRYAEALQAVVVARSGGSGAQGGRHNDFLQGQYVEALKSQQANQYYARLQGQYANVLQANLVADTQGSRREQLEVQHQLNPFVATRAGSNTPIESGSVGMEGLEQVMPDASDSSLFG